MSARRDRLWTRARYSQRAAPRVRPALRLLHVCPQASRPAIMRAFSLAGPRLGRSYFHLHLVSEFDRRDADRRLARRLGAISGRRLDRACLSAGAHPRPARAGRRRDRQRAGNRAVHPGRPRSVAPPRGGLRGIRLAVPSVLGPVLTLFKSYLGQSSTPRAGAQHMLNAEYFKRIDALNFTMMCDDGQLTEKLESADIVLLGVSRTSKTPTSIYLANRGYKTANIPLVPRVPLPARARPSSPAADRRPGRFARSDRANPPEPAAVAEGQSAKPNMSIASPSRRRSTSRAGCSPSATGRSSTCLAARSKRPRRRCSISIARTDRSSSPTADGEGQGRDFSAAPDFLWRRLADRFWPRRAAAAAHFWLASACREVEPPKSTSGRSKTACPARRCARESRWRIGAGQGARRQRAPAAGLLPRRRPDADPRGQDLAQGARSRRRRPPPRFRQRRIA